MNLSGRSLIGSREGAASGKVFFAMDPRSGKQLKPAFYPAEEHEIDQAARLAHDASNSYSKTSSPERAAFLRAIAANLEAIRDELVERASQETALPKPRLEGETARTCGQLRLFADLVEESSWVMARIDRALPERKPLPRPDLRSMLRPIGPVAVFGASNFPLAFSVAGGDTASALAAGNPVVVKAHPAHPGTSELAARAIRKAAADCKLHEGVFSLIFDSAVQAGIALVKHPLIKAVGFTGSHKAGRALMDAAASRPEPIPVFAEMSSTNPLFVLPGALRERSQTIVTGLYNSFTLGAGQFCTKPGLIFLPAGEETDRFTANLRELASGATPFDMLTAGIRNAYCSAVAERKSNRALQLIAEQAVAETQAGIAIFETEAASLLKHPELSGEVFGPATLLVRHRNRAEILAIVRGLEGHLTATIHGTEQDLRDFADLVEILETKVGRLIFNGFPTGVEVAHAMVHGGPYPATSDSRFTSVGTQAIFRFARPVCYQGFPNASLPEELKDENRLGIWRTVDGKLTKEPIGSQKL